MKIKEYFVSQYQLLSAIDKLMLILCIPILISLCRMPYGYYNILRLLVTIVSVLFCLIAYDKNKISAFVSGFIALIFQPFIKISIDRTTWHYIDVVVVVIIVIAVFSGHIRDIIKEEDK